MKKFNSAYLPYIGALSQAVLLTFAAVCAFGNWGYVIGPGVGVTASLSVATASSNFGSVNGKNRQWLAKAGMALMLIISASTVACSIYAPESVVTAVLWGAAADVSIVLAGAISGKGFVNSVENNTQVSETGGKKKGKKEKVSESVTQVTETLPKESVILPKVPRKSMTDGELLSYLAENPGVKHEQVAEYFGRTRQAVGQRIKKLYEVKQ